MSFFNSVQRNPLTAVGGGWVAGLGQCVFFICTMNPQETGDTFLRCPTSGTPILPFLVIFNPGQSTPGAQASSVNAPCGPTYLTLHSSLQWENALRSCFS